MTRQKLVSAKKVLDTFVDEHIIKGWSRVTDKDWRGFKETEHTLEFDGPQTMAISNEIYGRKAMLYFYFNNLQLAHRVLAILKKLGTPVTASWNYSKNTIRFEAQVSYFKGHRWWE